MSRSGFPPSSSWSRLDPLLERLVELEPDDAEAEIARLAQTDGELADRLRLALAAVLDEEGPLRGSAAELWPELWLSPEVSEQTVPGVLGSGVLVGRWRVTGALGVGGMGTVYAVDRADGVYEQRAALKMVRLGVDDPALRERFLRERQILARLEHPSIARLLDGGVAADGRPYLVLEQVDGEPITNWCDRRRLDVEARLRLFKDVCRGVQYAHQMLVVHRDLKPSNVLVDRTGQVKLLDFGIAKLLADDHQTPRAALQDAAAFTPQLAAPEQLARETVTTATDVYGLGMLLFELLVGSRPPRPMTTTPQELAAWLRERAPARPSEGLAASDDPTHQARLRRTTVKRLRRRVRGDLELICTKALQPSTEKRYPTAEAMADDLERCLQKLPIRARPSSIGYRLRRFVGRHRLAVVAGVVAVALLLAGFGGALWQGRIARREATTARAVIDFVVETFRGGDPASGGSTEVSARELLGRGIERLDAELGEQPQVRAELRTVLAEISINLGDAKRGLELATAALADQGTGRHDLGSRARAQRVVGTAQTALGDFVAAETTLSEARTLYQRMRPRMLAEEAEVLDRLAIVLQSLGRPGEALPLVEEALTYRTALSGNSPSVIDSMNNLAVLRREAGDLDGAIAMHREVLARRLRQLSEDHPSITDSLNNLGAALFHRGQLEEAAAFQEESLTRSRTTWGEAHPQVARARNNLAVTLREMGSLDRAEQQIVEVLEIWRQLGSAEHPHAVGSEFALAKIASLRGDLAGARSSFDRVISSWEVSLGPAHPNLAVALLERAGIERQQGDLDDADGDLARARPILEKALTAPHQHLAAAMAERGELAAARGDRAAALAAHGDALAMREQLYGARHPVTLSSSVAVAALLAEDEPTRAEAELRTALAMARELLPPPAPTLTTIELRAGRALCGLGDLEEALTALRAAAVGRAEAIGADRWPTWEARAMEVECLEIRGRTAAAAAAAAALWPPPVDLPAPLARRWSARSES